MTDLPPVRCDDESTWRHKGEKIDLPRLLQLIEENAGPEGLDLHGCDMRGIDLAPPGVPAKIQMDYFAGGTEVRPLCGQGVNLQRAHLERAMLSGANLTGAWLNEARMEAVWLSDANLSGAYLHWVSLQNAHLSQARLADAFLYSASLDHAELAWANLCGCDVRWTTFRYANLLGAELRHTDLRSCDLAGAFWRRAELDGTEMRREGLGRMVGEELAAKGLARAPIGSLTSFGVAREAYLALKTNFDSIGRYGDASWAYVKERQMDKAMRFPTTVGHRWIRRELRSGARRWRKKNPSSLRRFVRTTILARVARGWLHLRLFVGFCPSDIKSQVQKKKGERKEEYLDRRRWLRNWLYEATCGYGEDPWRPLIWAVVVIAAFTGIYAAAGNVASGEGGATHNLVTALTHSIAAFATVGFNTLEPVGWGARLLTAIEAMFGIGLFALFVFTLGNRMRRS